MIETRRFKIAFTDHETRVVTGTRMIGRSSGGITILDENKSRENDEGNLLQYSVFTVPEQTLKGAWEIEAEGEDGDSGGREDFETEEDDEWNESVVYEDKKDSEYEEISDDDGDNDPEVEENLWADGDDIEIDDSIEI